MTEPQKELHAIQIQITGIDTVELTYPTPAGPFVVGLNAESASCTASHLILAASTMLQQPGPRLLDPNTNPMPIVSWRAAPISNGAVGLLATMATGGTLGLQFDRESARQLAKVLEQIALAAEPSPSASKN